MSGRARRRSLVAVDLVKLRDLFCENRTRWFSSAELAERLGVGQRTVQRWIWAMDELGVPLETNRPDGGAVGTGVRYRVVQR